MSSIIIVDGVRPPVAQERSLLTPEEVAEYFQVNRQWVYERTSKNEIPYIKVGKYLRFQRQEIERWTERGYRVRASCGGG